MAIKYKYKKVEDYDKNLHNIQKQMDIFYDNFSKSQYFQKLSEAEKENAHFAISTFAEIMYNYCDEFPDEWSEDAIAEVLCDLFPRKLSVGQEFYKNVESILRAFFFFLDIKQLIVPLKRYCRVMIKKAKDSRNWGTAKKFVMSAMDKGVDVQDKGAMDQFMLEYNREQMKKHQEKEAGKADFKVGRNDPCPCVSGKKYKK